MLNEMVRGVKDYLTTMTALRKANESDIDKLSILFDDYRVFYKKKTDVEGAKKFLIERIKNNESQIFVAENDERELMGFVQLYPVFSSTRMKRLWLLNDLFVKPAFRSKGVSIALIDECKELCRQSGSCGLLLETAKDNTIGNNLYLKTGFLLDDDHNYYEWETQPPQVKPENHDARL
ncbi:MAG: GNAT family N-acetyltransferase [Ferruginibacter sp.]